MKRKVLACKMILLFLAIQKNEKEKVYDMITEKPKLLFLTPGAGLTPIHYAIHLNNEVLAEMLFKKAPRAILEKSGYYGSTFPYSSYSLSGLQAAYNHNMMQFFENNGLLPEYEIKKCKEEREKRSHIDIFYECMYYKEIETALYHFEKSSSESITNFLSKLNIFEPRRVLLYHKNENYLKRFLEKLTTIE
ncbi:hypothetical protein M153_13540002346, partial [Pseudoloma neurophilia]